MLPSLLARDIQTGIKQFLVTGFEPADDFFHGLMKRFVDKEIDWMKGPFLQIGLPFRQGISGKTFFGHFETQFPGHTHQESAWKRLSSNIGAANTLIATGTGSGKTECFLYPVLDHCSRALASGEKGIKTLVIYPMNALATDQARRFAEVVAGTPAFAGLRVGLFVGGRIGDPGSGMVMTPTGVITDRDTLRKNPPDILLTNYKMLDYLLLRPKDRQLWVHNTPTTLRYVVVDELHTFDGAQGTDLALLLRRLRARLKSPENHLICAGTSATLGGASDTSPLREYARQVFAAPFPQDAVIMEDRLSVAEFLGDGTIDHFLQAQPDLTERLDPNRYTTQQQAVAAWFNLFFPDLPEPTLDDVDDAGWRITLGERLKKHLLFVNLLKLIKNGAADFADLEQQMQGPLPAAARAHIREVLDALLVLLAWAREPGNGNRPLATLRVQIWIRELRRMVAKVHPAKEFVDLRASNDLKSTPNGFYLPLIQCSECHTTGWLSRLPSGSNKLSNKLDEIYNTWFAGRSEAVRLYPGSAIQQPQVDGVPMRLCSACGNLQGSGDKCHACGQTELVSVFQTIGTRSSVRGALASTWHDGTCPACGGKDRLILLGARAATLGSQVVEHSWASPFNDDKKLIAFSDSVQDAAHRAGFFTARTYANTIRTALAKAIDLLAKPTVAWSHYLAGVVDLTSQAGSPLHMNTETLVSEFIGPNMTWQRDWHQELILKGALPANSRLPERVKKRLGWQAVSEFTYLSHRGRNLDRIGKATLAPPIEVIKSCALQLIPVLREEFGGQNLDDKIVVQWLWGFLAHLRRRGAVFHPELASFAKDSNLFAFMRGRNEWMPSLGLHTPRPVFLTLGQHRDFDRLSVKGRFTWFERWATVTLGQQMLIAQGQAEAMYLSAITILESKGILIRTDSSLGDSIALAPDQLMLHSSVKVLVSGQGRRALTIPADAVDELRDMPCLDAVQECYSEVNDAGGWLSDRFSNGNLRRVISAEHTGLLERSERESLEIRFKAKAPKPWYENLLSATPTLEMGVDIGDLSSVLLCSVPPNQASYLQRIGRAGRRDGNAMTTTLADGASPHDLYFFAETQEMITGEVSPPGVFLKAAEVLRRQLFAYCLDDWVGTITNATALPDKTSVALDAVERADLTRFPYIFIEHVLKNEPRLLQAFLDMLGNDIDANVTLRLTQFMQGTGDVDGLRLHLIKVLEEQAAERKDYKKRADKIKGQIAEVNKKPQDQSTINEIDQLKRERDKVLELVKEINQRELLNTLTDAGLIPNYAFPEAGIELKSVLWRKKATDDHGDNAYVALPAIKYERPANSALSEFAPENRFYANQRRVEVDQINMSLAKLEWWRLCPDCHHMENLEFHADAHSECPNCGNVMWSDQAQRRQLLRFRQAIANSDDTKVRIDDSADDREPKFYVRQLLADFDNSDIKEAWSLKTADLPFGFEFIAKVNFRDVNFGELSKPGDTFKVADQETMRPGFKLCRHCGKVQTAPRGNTDDQSQIHAFDCEKRDSNDQADLVDCLYLYREFQSEALRILVPYTSKGMDDGVIQSFMAAMQLGLKKRFGGKVDHLRLVLQDEPGKEGGPRRQYIMLYDSVPGGTGYLHQLLAQDAGTLSDVLRLALDALNKCGCNSDPDKDGCYRCLYQYRLGRKMEQVSRERAKEVLTELVTSLGKLEKVPTISDIFINPNFDSPLESRFIESLRRLGGVNGIPLVKLVQDIVNGKSGYLLEVGAQRYWIEPQHKATASDGVKNPSRPDFILWPAQNKSTRRAIAVFCDGWKYHNTSIRADAQKRSALVASRQYWVWSVTHEDVKAAINGETTTDLESPLTSMSRHNGEKANASLVRAENNAFSRNAVAQLLLWLACESSEKSDPVVTQLQRNSIWATFLMVAIPSSPDFVGAKAKLSALLEHLPDWMHAVPTPNLPAISRPDAHPSLQYWWPASFATGAIDQALTPGLLVLDDSDDVDDKNQQLRWRRWLALFNTFQTLPGLVMASKQGIDANDYASLEPVGVKPPSNNGQASALNAAWVDALESVAENLKEGLLLLAKGNAELPEVGGDVANDSGKVVAQAELIWHAKKVLVLLEGQQEDYEMCLSLGWTVVLAQGEWVAAVQSKLMN